MLAGIGMVAYLGEPGASSRKVAVPKAHLAPCVEGETCASGVSWPSKCQRVYGGGH